MGSRFYQKPPTIGVPNTNMAARAIGASGYASRVSAGANQKDLGAALALLKTHAFKPQQRGAAYPKGPKI